MPQSWVFVSLRAHGAHGALGSISNLKIGISNKKSSFEIFVRKYQLNFCPFSNNKQKTQKAKKAQKSGKNDTKSVFSFSKFPTFNLFVPSLDENLRAIPRLLRANEIPADQNDHRLFRVLLPLFESPRSLYRFLPLFVCLKKFTTF